MSPGDFDALFSGPMAKVVGAKKIIVMLGAGGVGKTTTSVATALLGAKAGKRVALLSIDPAKRLAAALGIPLGNDLRSIEWPQGVTIEGTVDAAMLDQKAVFDRMVLRHAKGPEAAAKILEHPLYIAASSNLSGPLEYMALAKLQELADDPKYDLIVLDTPPDTHALDFLARPNVLSGFMDNKVMAWLIKPFLVAGRFGLGRLLSASEKLMGGIARITGGSALRSFAEFLVLIQEVLEGFQKSGERITGILQSPETAFVLVTIPTPAAARSAAHLDLELRELGYGVDVLILNRCLDPKVGQDISKLPQGEAQKWLLARLSREESVTRQLAGQIQRTWTVKVKDQLQDMGSLGSMLDLAEQIGQSGATPPAC